MTDPDSKFTIEAVCDKNIKTPEFSKSEKGVKIIASGNCGF